MTVSQSSKKITIALLAIVFGAPILLFGFQNCGKSGFDNTACLDAEDQEACLANEETNASKSNEVTDGALAFDVTPNQITFMSVVPDAALNLQGYSINPQDISNKSAYFTFKIGAFPSITRNVAGTQITFPSGGIKLTQNFIDEANKMYGQSGATPRDATVEELFNYLKISVENKRMSPVFSIRQNGYEKISMPLSSSSNPLEGIDYSMPIPDLTAPQVTVPLFNEKSNYVSYFPLNSMIPENRVLDGQIVIHDRIALNTFRDSAYTGNQLMMTFASLDNDVLDPVVARSPSSAEKNEVNKVYGKKYLLRFSPPGSQYSNPFLTSVDEYDALTNKPVEVAPNIKVAWSCNDVAPYIVTRKEDAFRCLQYTENELQDGQLNFEYQVLRRHLNPQHWVIGLMVNPLDASLKIKCVRPIVGNPYNSYIRQNVALTEIEPLYMGGSACGPSYSKDCAHYVNVCLRK